MKISVVRDTILDLLLVAGCLPQRNVLLQILIIINYNLKGSTTTVHNAITTYSYRKIILATSHLHMNSIMRHLSILKRFNW